MPQRGESRARRRRGRRHGRVRGLRRSTRGVSRPRRRATSSSLPRIPADDLDRAAGHLEVVPARSRLASGSRAGRPGGGEAAAGGLALGELLGAELLDPARRSRRPWRGSSAGDRHGQSRRTSGTAIARRTRAGMRASDGDVPNIPAEPPGGFPAATLEASSCFPAPAALRPCHSHSLPIGPQQPPHAARRRCPRTRAEMLARGWDEVDVVFVTGDAYVDHPSFANGLIARLLEAAGFRVAVLAQPDWQQLRALAAVRPAAALLRRLGRQHGLDDQPLHGQPEGPQRRRLFARTARSAGGPTGPRSPTASGRARRFPGVPVVAGGVEAASGGWPTTTTGATPSAARSSSTRRPTSSSSAWASGRSLDVARGLAAGKTREGPPRPPRRRLPARAPASRRRRGARHARTARLRSGRQPTSSPSAR